MTVSEANSRRQHFGLHTEINQCSYLEVPSNNALQLTATRAVCPQLSLVVRGSANDGT